MKTCPLIRVLLTDSARTHPLCKQRLCWLADKDVHGLQTVSMPGMCPWWPILVEPGVWDPLNPEGKFIQICDTSAIASHVTPSQSKQVVSAHVKSDKLSPFHLYKNSILHTYYHLHISSCLLRLVVWRSDLIGQGDILQNTLLFIFAA